MHEQSEFFNIKKKIETIKNKVKLSPKLDVENNHHNLWANVLFTALIKCIYIHIVVHTSMFTDAIRDY